MNQIDTLNTQGLLAMAAYANGISTTDLILDAGMSPITKGVSFEYFLEQPCHVAHALN